MKKYAKIFSIIMAVVMLSSLCACANNGGNSANNGGGTALENIKVPDKVNYSNSGKQFNYFTYKSINAGKYEVIEGSFDVGESFVTKEYIKEYFESGMKFLSTQVVATPSADETKFSTSLLKQVLDWTHELGYDKSVVITDNVLYSPYNTVKAQAESGSLVGEEDFDKYSIIGNASWQYKNEAELDAVVEKRIKLYGDHPAFQGVFLPDEPYGKYLKVIGETFRSIRRVEKKLGREPMYININLLPYGGTALKAFPAVEQSFHSSQEQRNHEQYRRYIDTYFKETGADFVQVDIYPMYESDMNDYYVLNAMILADVAKKYDAKVILINQAHYNKGQRPVSYESINYQNNLFYGFGALNIGYYAYFTLDDGGKYIHHDPSSMMSRFGDKGKTYDIVKSINAVGQELAKTILNFNYNTAVMCYSNEFNYVSDHVDTADTYLYRHDFSEFNKLTAFDVDKESCVVTELYDADKENYMYMAFNAIDPLNKGATTYQTAKLTFAKEYNKAYAFYNGGYKVYDLDSSNSLTVKMRPGEAHYIIPYAG